MPEFDNSAEFTPVPEAVNDNVSQELCTINGEQSPIIVKHKERIMDVFGHLYGFLTKTATFDTIGYHKFESLYSDEPLGEALESDHPVEHLKCLVSYLESIRALLENGEGDGAKKILGAIIVEGNNQEINATVLAELKSLFANEGQFNQLIEDISIISLVHDGGETEGRAGHEDRAISLVDRLPPDLLQELKTTSYEVCGQSISRYDLIRLGIDASKMDTPIPATIKEEYRESLRIDDAIANNPFIKLIRGVVYASDYERMTSASYVDSDSRVDSFVTAGKPIDELTPEELQSLSGAVMDSGLIMLFGAASQELFTGMATHNADRKSLRTTNLLTGNYGDSPERALTETINFYSFLQNKLSPFHELLAAAESLDPDFGLIKQRYSLIENQSRIHEFTTWVKTSVAGRPSLTDELVGIAYWVTMKHKTQGKNREEILGWIEKNPGNLPDFIRQYKVAIAQAQEETVEGK